jgi:hypothetical protein
MGALERLDWHGTFKSQALWSIRDGKGLIGGCVCLSTQRISKNIQQNFLHSGTGYLQISYQAIFVLVF